MNCFDPAHYLNATNKYKLFGNQRILNWLLISAPMHPFLNQTLFNMVEAVRTIYLHQPILSNDLQSPFFSLICSTGPGILTASIGQVLDQAIHNKQHGQNENTTTSTITAIVEAAIKFRCVGMNFDEYGGKFKATNEVWDKSPNHYSKLLRKDSEHKLLSRYAPLPHLS